MNSNIERCRYLFNKLCVPLQIINGTAHTVGGGVGNLFWKEQRGPDGTGPHSHARRQGPVVPVPMLHQ